MPWPKKGNKAFQGKGGGKFVQPKSIFFWPFPQHASAFKTAADMVIDAYEAAPRAPHHDEIIFPVAYLYRHSLELKLKNILEFALKLGMVERAEADRVVNEHDLAKLWTNVKRVITKRWKDADPTPVSAVEAIINEIHQLDPNSQVFRYASDRSGRLNRYKRLPDLISVGNLRQTMDGVYTFLDCVLTDFIESLEAMSGNY
jgi:hypothetical protein